MPLAETTRHNRFRRKPPVTAHREYPVFALPCGSIWAIWLLIHCINGCFWSWVWHSAPTRALMMRTSVTPIRQYRC